MIENAKIHFNDHGTPVAENFDDVYFSNDDGLAESDFVFFKNNHIAKRWQSENQFSFVIAETGFGTGLNFFNTWAQFAADSLKKVQHLHFISFEKYPLSAEALSQAFKAWPQFAELQAEFIAQYPIPLQGCHRLEFMNGKVTLDLWLGDIQDSLCEMAYPQAGMVDAWFLDGFAPGKNPDMWQQSLFDAMANLARKCCTFATFTAAGFVRRGLIEAGFDVSKVKGFGRKREMLVGQIGEPNQAKNLCFQLDRGNHAYPTPANKTAIIGGGIAAASLAYALAKRGETIDVFCADQGLAMGASHNRQGALYPSLEADLTPSSEMYALGFQYALNTYKQLINTGHAIDHQWCGVLLQAVTDAKLDKQHSLLRKGNWPSQLVTELNAEQASELAGVDAPYPSLYFPKAGWVNPVDLVKALFAEAKQLSAFNVFFDTQINTVQRIDQQWQLQSESKSYQGYDKVIIACGEHSFHFIDNRQISFRPVRGQVSHIAESEQSSSLKTVLCHKGYFTPSYQGEHCMGASFIKNEMGREVNQEEHQLNHQQFKRFYQDADWGASLDNINSGKAAIRCTIADHIPVVGAKVDPDEFVTHFAALRNGKQTSNYQDSQQGMYVFSGLGARGLCSAPLLAELLASDIYQQPLPVSKRVSDACHSQRFLVRDLKRKKI